MCISSANLQKSESKVKVILDRRLLSLIRRLMQLSDGRYLLTLTKAGDSVDLTVTELGKVEHVG